MTALRSLSDAVLGIAVNYRETNSPQLLGSQDGRSLGSDLVRDRSGTSVPSRNLRIVRAGSPRAGGQDRSDHPGSAGAARVAARRFGCSICTAAPVQHRFRSPQRGARVTLVESFAPCCRLRASRGRRARARRASRSESAMRGKSFARSRPMAPPSTWSSPTLHAAAWHPRCAKRSPASSRARSLTCRAIPTRSRAIWSTSPSSATAPSGSNRST